ncbi:MAG TPA: leucine-rich repeat domain-containing protein [Paludibacter sp.]
MADPCTGDVTIPDAAFKTALLAIAGLDDNSDGEIQCSVASAYTGSIDVSGLSISDLTGIEAFTKITGLNCSYNSLPSLNVSNNTVLTSLTCNNNSLTSLDVSANTALTYLDCSNNSLTALDVSSNTALTYLYCRNNQLSSLNTSGVAALTELHCAYNQLASLDISTNTVLTVLGCSNNQLTSLDVSANTDLSKLHCQNNQITSLDVSANTALISLYCSSNLLTSLNVKNGNNTSLDFNATSNPDLTCIQVDNAAYSTNNWTYDVLESFSTDCACIVNIPNINFKNALVGNTDININGDDQIQCFEATAYAGSINVNGQSITDLTGIEAFTALSELYCSVNSLTTLDVSTNTALQYLDCSGNLLTSLDVSGLTSLYKIDCHENSLTTLDVSSNKALQYLYCYSNSLTSLNVSGLTSLSEISCSNNQLASLDFSSNTALYYLDCSYNSLRSLNVKNGNNSSFTNFDATNNLDLTCIQIDGGGVDYSGLPWTNKDAGASYNEVCGWSTVNIPDPNFKAALIGNDAIDNNPADDEIQYDEATAYTGVIIVSGLSIANLTGIEAFTKITNLYCSYNSLMTLDVSANTALTDLYCNDNHLTILNVKNTNNSNFTNFNATNNPDLTCIQIDGGGVDYSGSPWINKDAGASYNEVCTVNIPDPNFKAALIGNGIDINADGEIQYDEASAYLDGISVSGSGISDLTGIEAFTNITYLYCSNNSLTTLDVSSNTDLQYLDCSDNSLTSLDVSANTALEYLYCRNNQLLSLNTSGVAALTELHCAYNQLASLDISTNTALTILGCSNNQLTSLDVSDNTDLSQLHCQYNQITSLDVSANKALTSLYCYNNLLRSLNVQNGNNDIISDFDATSNPSLSCIQVDDADDGSTDSWSIDTWASFNTSCEAPIVWNGSTDSDWNTATNWDLISVPTASKNIIIPDVTNDPIISSSGASCSNLSIESSGELTLTATGSLTVGNTCNYSGNVTIQSNATGTGSLIVANVSGSGTASAERYMTGNKWHLVSPIVEGESINTFITSDNNAIPSKVVSETDNRAMMDYNETDNSWNSYFTAATDGNLTAGKGYSVRRSDDGIVTFTGTLASGTKLVSLSMGGMGWNCIGNPYTSAINMNDAANGTYNFLKSNSSVLDGSYACMYVWDDATLSYKILGNANYDGRDLRQNIFQSGQGFFVKAASDGFIVEFNNNMQVHQTGAMFKARASTLSWPGITLTASSIATSSSAIITFNDKMTNGLDPTYDAGLLRGTNGLSLYTRLLEDNGVDFAVQCLPENYNNLVIPVGVDCRDGGEITFSAQTVDLPAACNVILEDRTTKTFTTLTGGTTYKTTVLAGTTDIGRFYIRTGDNFTTGTSGLTAAICNLKAYTVNGAIIIEGEVSDQAIATLYDLQGLKVLVHSLQKGSLNILSCPDLINGIYLFTIQQDGEIVTRKLIMK